ncbi:substrate-binding domain-containing protein [Prescottella soli]
MSVVLDRARAAQWRVAMVVPLQGPAGLFGPSCEAIGELAAHDINNAGGILGREAVIHVVDGGDHPEVIAAEVNRLVSAGAIDAVSGWHISSVRHALAPVVAGRIPYSYTSLYEGGETRSGIYCCGETPRQQIAPALKWLRDNVGARRWIVVGDDYVWPHGSLGAVRAYARELDLRIVGESFVDLGRGNMNRVVDSVAASDCDGVLMLLVGQDAVDFNRAFARRGLDERILRFSPLMEENMLLASGPRATRNLFVAAAYFRSLVDADALDLVGRYVALHGATAPPLNNAAESCYEGIQTLAHLIHRAGTTSPDALDIAFDGVAYDGPRGTVEFRNRVARQRIHLAVANGLDFEVVATL